MEKTENDKMFQICIDKAKKLLIDLCCFKAVTLYDNGQRLLLRFKLSIPKKVLWANIDKSHFKGVLISI